MEVELIDRLNAASVRSIQQPCSSSYRSEIHKLYLHTERSGACKRLEISCGYLAAATRGPVTAALGVGTGSFW